MRDSLASIVPSTSAEAAWPTTQFSKTSVLGRGIPTTSLRGGFGAVQSRYSRTRQSWQPGGEQELQSNRVFRLHDFRQDCVALVHMTIGHRLDIPGISELQLRREDIIRQFH